MEATLSRVGELDTALTHKNKHRKPNRMGRKENMPQMKEQEKCPEKNSNEMKMSHLLYKELKEKVIMSLNKFERIENMSTKRK